jgi:hypothetical protein
MHFDYKLLEGVVTKSNGVGFNEINRAGRVTVPPSISFAGPDFDQPTVATMILRTHARILVGWQVET